MKAANTACKKVVAEAKLQYREAQAKDKPGDLMTMWQSLKILRRAYNPPDHDLTAADGRLLQSLEEKAQGFLQHFASASTTAELPMAKQQLRREREEAMDLSPPSGQDEPLTHFELTRALRGIRSTKSSPGGDRITYPLLKKLPNPYLKMLLALFSKCWREGTVPQAWKDAIVVPVPKANKPRRVVSSYRPVSLTSHLGKLYERIMLERLQLFIQQKNLLPRYQAGFRKGRSVTDHTVKLGEHMRKALARKRVMLSCFFDIARAFDTVWHGKLLYQLKQAGISPSRYRFINSFLTGRTMAVRWKNTISPKRTIDTGVPQGSVIAPMLFTLMLQDVGKGLQKDTTLTAYADDLAIWRTTTVRRPNKNGPWQKSALKIFQNEVNTIVRSLRDSGFMLSAQKTVFMPVMPKGVSSPDNLQIDVQGTPVKGSHSVRYLGVTFQCIGHWTKQVDRAIANARKALNLLRAVRRESWGQERKTLVHLTLSLVRSRLLFGSQALFSLPPSHMQRLAAVECTALRLALGLPRGVPQRRVYNEAGVLPL